MTVHPFVLLVVAVGLLVALQRLAGARHRPLWRHPVEALRQAGFVGVQKLTISQREGIIAHGMSQIGTAERPPHSNKQPYGRWWGWDGVAWCAIYVSWVYHTYLGFSPFPVTGSKGYASCALGRAWFKARGAWAPNTVVAKRGWIVFFTFSHTGIVLEDRGTHVLCLEGNTGGDGGRDGGVVMLHLRAKSLIRGYGVIDYVPDKPVAPHRPRIVIPNTPALTVTLHEGIKTDTPELVTAVRFLHNRLNVILPHWQWKLGPLRTDALFDPETTIAVVYAKVWCNALARLGKKPEPFKEINGLVGNTTLAVFAIWGAHYQQHPK